MVVVVMLGGSEALFLTCWCPWRPGPRQAEPAPHPEATAKALGREVRGTKTQERTDLILPARVRPVPQ